MPMYWSALHKFAEFCSLYSILLPFPVSEPILCYFSSHLTCQSLSPQTIKSYLAFILHMQIMLGLPEPRAFSSLPHLRLVQSRIQRTCSMASFFSWDKVAHNSRYIKKDLRAVVANGIRSRHTDVMGSCSHLLFSLPLWGITVPSQNFFDSRKHLSWGDIAVDNRLQPTMLKVKAETV